MTLAIVIKNSFTWTHCKALLTTFLGVADHKKRGIRIITINIKSSGQFEAIAGCFFDTSPCVPRLATQH